MSGLLVGALLAVSTPSPVLSPHPKASPTHAAGLLDRLPHLHLTLWPPLVSVLLPFLLGMLLMPWVIGRLDRAGMGQRIRPEGPKSHLGKSGTPTSGGLAVVGLILLMTALLDRSPVILPVLGAMLLGAALGLADDVATVKGSPGTRGLLARQKIVLQAGIGLVLGYWFLRIHQDVQLIPFLGTWHMGWLLVPAAALALVASSNAFNLTDGSDGLAPGVMLIVAVVLALTARHLHHQVALVRLLLFSAGALAAFLAYNLPPARVFLGGVGSEGIGMLLAAAAISAGLLWYLPLVALVPVVETASVMLQVYYFKRYRRRILRMSPLHHHFQLGGWGEWRVALSAWGVSAAAGTVSLLLTRKMR